MHAIKCLYWNPTAWHNKKIAGGWLYNRSHLIGYQLTGQNNNPKNLITGTRQSNDPGMLKYEFRGRELLARGVEMEAQSTGSNAVRFHVYIFNVQDGIKLNYSNGTSVVTGAAKKSAKKTVVKKAAAKKSTSSKKKIKTSTTGRIVGNRRYKIYHVPGQAGYHMNSANAVYFRTETEAKRAGYRRAPR
ncbi:DNA-entry nuclease [Lactobacillus delbrueckii subsp. bulgaricus]|nr:DNA-entry nuclease [Lactobacillus delbrueckii subsp. bulgaricus]MBT8936985.1 DNA-entry nuclease [Lactobacillus delbrueckii subsp. bulgaricus]MBT8949627.1 DNA-entry nuclease [Lactobacillus delbrueckii subsp. bulgaricus]MBT8960805.1 DNA-entry nuclease [Lactobacillus delbrueckii subsp. bulgaricus]MBT8962503.1 DNA-entry nuclease [Lactobacillus delbrueckii subsp. bulgaricus]